MHQEKIQFESFEHRVECMRLILMPKTTRAGGKPNSPSLTQQWEQSALTLKFNADNSSELGLVEGRGQ